MTTISELRNSQRAKIPLTGLSKGGAALPGEPAEFQRFIAGSAPISLDGIDWDSIPEHDLPQDVIRILT